MTNATWGGRFEAGLSAAAVELSTSVGVDKRLAAQDIQGSLAHALMLERCGVLTQAEHEILAKGLQAVGEEIAQGKMTWDPAREDVHMNIESRLVELVGDVGKKLHTGRSRNDQVATDMRLWTRQACTDTMARIDQLLAVLCVRAETHLGVLMPGYTHLQRAQPVRLSHHLLAWAEMLDRDHGRLHDARERLNESPLGAGALATTTFPIDRVLTAKTLGFLRPMANSMDAVADRDFLIEVNAALAICSVHLSRIAEELVIWTTQEFGFVEMSDTYATGSSMMPQKKNPDVAELVRGKTGRVIGDLVNLMVLQKGLPLTYNRDLQEDKPPVFDAFDTVNLCLDATAGMLATLVFAEDRMHAALRDGHLDATEVADYLSARGVPFRDAHHVSGKLVAHALETGKTLAELRLEEFKTEHPLFEKDIYPMLTPEAAIERRQVLGGPAKTFVQSAAQALRTRLEQRQVNIEEVTTRAGWHQRGGQS